LPASWCKDGKDSIVTTGGRQPFTGNCVSNVSKVGMVAEKYYASNVDIYKLALRFRSMMTRRQYDVPKVDIEKLTTASLQLPT
jgi:hypothetical protein